MRISKKEEEMLEGRYGGAVQKSMELLLAVGECYGAERFVEAGSAHLSCANPVSAGKGGTRFIKEMAEKGGKFAVPTTTNPASLDPWLQRWRGRDPSGRTEAEVPGRQQGHAPALQPGHPGQVLMGTEAGARE